MALKRRLLKDVILSEVLGSLSMCKRNKLQSAIQAHNNKLIESQCQTICNRLNQLKINYVLEKTYDEKFYLVFKIISLEFNFEVLVAENSLENRVTDKEYDNMHFIKSLVELDDEFNFDSNSYNECRKVVKAVYEHISSKCNLSYEESRKMEIQQLEELYLLNNMY